MIEEWRPVVGYEGLYEVSNTGRVRSLDRYVKGKGKSYFLHKGRILSPGIKPEGYLVVRLQRRMFYVHRLVIEAFIPNPDNLPEVNHKDEDKENNSVQNLEWCTDKYNQNYGTRTQRISEKNTNGKLSKPVLQYEKSGGFVKEWKSTWDVERNLGYFHNYISDCCTGRYKCAYGFIWKYKD